MVLKHGLIGYLRQWDTTVPILRKEPIPASCEGPKLRGTVVPDRVRFFEIFS